MKNVSKIMLLVILITPLIFIASACSRRGEIYNGQSETPTNLRIEGDLLKWEHTQLFSRNFMASRRQSYSIYVNDKMLLIVNLPQTWMQTEIFLSQLDLHDGDKIQIRANAFSFTPDGLPSRSPYTRWSDSDLSEPLFFSSL